MGCIKSMTGGDCKAKGYAPYNDMPKKCPKCGSDIDMLRSPSYFLEEGQTFDPSYQPKNPYGFPWIK